MVDTIEKVKDAGVCKTMPYLEWVQHMRKFDYYLFENFDPDCEADHPDNPRNFLNSGMDPVLSQIINCGAIRWSCIRSSFNSYVIAAFFDLSTGG